MTVIIIISAITVLLGLLLISRIYITVSYVNEVEVYFRFLIIKKKIYKNEKKKFKRKKHKKTKIKAKQNHDGKIQNTQQKKSITQSLRLIFILIKKIYKKFLGSIRIDIKELTVNVASDDPAKTALIYPQIYSLTSIIINFISENVKLKNKGQIYVSPDFTKQKTTCNINISLSISVFKAIALAFKTSKNYLVNKHNSNTRRT